MKGGAENEDEKLHRRRWAVETSVWKNRKGASLKRILQEAQQLEEWLLRDRKAEIRLINNERKDQ